MVAEACASASTVKIPGKAQAKGKLIQYFKKLDQLGRTTNSIPLHEVDRVAEQLIMRGALLA